MICSQICELLFHAAFMRSSCLSELHSTFPWCLFAVNNMLLKDSYPWGTTLLFLKEGSFFHGGVIHVLRYS